MKWYYKVLLGLFLLIVIVLVSIDIIVTRLVDKEIKQIQLELSDTYHFEYDHIDVAFLEKHIILKNFKFITIGDSTNLKSKFDFNIDKLHIEIDNYREALNNGKIHISTALLEGPKILYGVNRELNKNNVNENSFSEVADSNQVYSIDTLSNSFVKYLLIDDLKIMDGEANIYHLNKPEKKLLNIKNVLIKSTDFLIDLTTNNVNQVVKNNGMLIEFKDVSTDELKHHTLTVGKIDFFYSKNELLLSDLIFKNTETPVEYVSQQKYRSPWLDIKVDSIRINVNPIQIYNKGVLHIKDISIFGVDAILYNDVTLALKPIHQPMPSRAIRDIAEPFKIDQISIDNGHLKYNHKTDAENPGLFELNELNVKVKNLTNIEYIFDTDSLMEIDVNALLWDSGELSAMINIDLKSELDNVFIKGSVLNMPLDKAENMIKPLYGVTVSSGQLINLTYDLTMNENIGKGKMRFDYSDLKVDIKKDSTKHIDDDGNVKSNRFLNFVANEAVITNNVRGDKRYKPYGTMIFNRTKNKPIFDLYWHTLQTGIMDIALSDALYKSKSHYQKEEKKKEKQRKKAKKK